MAKKIGKKLAAAIGDSQIVRLSTYMLKATVVPAAGSYTTNIILDISGKALPGYDLQTVHITFIPDSQALMVPDYNSPIVRCSMNNKEYEAIMDIVKKGIDEKDPSTSLYGLYVPAPAMVFIFLGSGELTAKVINSLKEPVPVTAPIKKKQKKAAVKGNPE